MRKKQPPKAPLLNPCVTPEILPFNLNAAPARASDNKQNIWNIGNKKNEKLPDIKILSRKMAAINLNK